jgi:mono/diheme cytochrome c family protein
MNVREHMSATPRQRVKRAVSRWSGAMRRLPPWLFIACIGGAITVAAQPAPSSSRGELLYSNHCIGCHTAQVHWRDHRLATDWASLRAQVLRWQGNTGLAWSDDNVLAVTRYLNDRYYRFPEPGTPVALRASPGWSLAPMDRREQ